MLQVLLSISKEACNLVDSEQASQLMLNYFGENVAEFMESYGENVPLAILHYHLDEIAVKTKQELDKVIQEFRLLDLKVKVTTEGILYLSLEAPCNLVFSDKVH